MTKPTGIDESWSRADWAELQRRGITVASLYFSRDPTKNAKPSDIKAAHRHNIGILLNWEGFAGAPLNGAAQGLVDAREWVQQRDALIRAVGYAPKNQLSALFSCDRDINNEQMRGPVAAYYAATQRTVRPAGALNGVYGEYDLVDYLHKRGLTEVEWQTYAWSNGKLSPEADFYQYLNSQNIGGAAVDFDRVIHAAQLGAWWPPGHKFDTANPAGQADSLWDWIGSMTPAERKAFIDEVSTATANKVWSKTLSGKRDGKVVTASASAWTVYADLKAEAARDAALALGKALAVAFDAKKAAADVLTAFKLMLP